MTLFGLDLVTRYINHSRVSAKIVKTWLFQWRTRYKLYSMKLDNQRKKNRIPLRKVNEGIVRLLQVSDDVAVGFQFTSRAGKPVPLGIRRRVNIFTSLCIFSLFLSKASKKTLKYPTSRGRSTKDQRRPLNRRSSERWSKGTILNKRIT